MLTPWYFRGCQTSPGPFRSRSEVNWVSPTRNLGRVRRRQTYKFSRTKLQIAYVSRDIVPSEEPFRILQYLSALG